MKTAKILMRCFIKAISSGSVLLLFSVKFVIFKNGIFSKFYTILYLFVNHFNLKKNELHICQKVILAHPIRISEILPFDRKSYHTHAILPRTSSNVIV